MDGREWREGDGGRRRAASGSGAMASVEKFGDEHGKTPTGHERTNWEHGEKDKEMANVTRALVGASKHWRQRMAWRVDGGWRRELARARAMAAALLGLG